MKILLIQFFIRKKKKETNDARLFLFIINALNRGSLMGIFNFLFPNQYMYMIGYVIPT